MMTDFCVIGTDTDAGKTTFALLWLSVFGDRYGYWKPMETGQSDSQRVRRLVPTCRVWPPLRYFAEPVAPSLAARRQGESIPLPRHAAAARPNHSPLIVETFGGPLSPWGEGSLQVEFLRELGLPLLLVASSAVGAVGRTLSCLRALSVEGLGVKAVVLIGPRDPFAEAEITHHGGARVFSLEGPGDSSEWTALEIADSASRQRQVLLDLAEWLVETPRPDPARPDLTRPDPARPDPARPDPARLENARPDPARSADWVRRDQQAVWHPYTSLQPPDPPIVVTATSDEFLHLADGRRIIDGISSWWTILFGHRDPVLIHALTEAARSIDHVHFAGTTHPWAVDLAEQMLATMPWSGGRVFFSDNGSTAVEVALKLAYQFWLRRGEGRRTLFVGFEHGYHGDTFGAMAVGRDPVFFGDFEPLLFRAIQIPLDADALDHTLKANAGDVAAVIIEPLVQGAGGMRMHPPAVLKDIAEVTQRHDSLLIVDEVMTGGGRLGPLWAHQAAAIAPDLICAAKTLTGGMMPLAATIASPTIVEAWETSDPAKTFFHGHSFTAHPLACAVAAANWRRLPRTAQPKAAAMETFWQESLGSLRDHPRVRDVRIRGSIVAVELEDAGGYLAGIGRQIRRSCLDLGVLLRPLGSVVYAMPPLNTSTASLERISEAIRRAIADACGEARGRASTVALSNTGVSIDAEVAGTDATASD
ncbi:MAG: adenosylmethionine--8-amino-7-oxononanoate transaminase [Gemmataceae bacterium]|nr:adenosylmethionine--8-amino-7-oxononanoate transaminase [Gemmataceae bacterium]